MQMFPVVSKVNGHIVAGTTVEANSDRLAVAINTLAEADVVKVGRPIELNPSWGKAKDPQRTALKAFLVLALEGADVVVPVAA